MVEQHSKVMTRSTLGFEDLAKFAYGGLILSANQFLLLPQLPQKMKLPWPKTT
jgi:hypothetical protein